MLIKIIRELLQDCIDRIDAGNSNLSEDECVEVIKIMLKYTSKDIPMSKYEAFTFLGVSRATFDNLVRDGFIPKGQKMHAGDNNLFWYEKDLLPFRRTEGRNIIANYTEN